MPQATAHMDHNALLDAAGSGIGLGSGIGAALISAFVSLITLLVGSWGTAVKRRADERVAAATREEQIQKLAMEQWELASKSLRADLERYRQEVDRLRADNDRLTRLADELTGRQMNLERELTTEREARQRAEAQVADLMRRLGGAA